MKIEDFEIGDVFSEINHLITEKIDTDKITFRHLESGESVELSVAYAVDLLKSANFYDKVVKVTSEDTYWTKVKIAKAEKSGLYTPETLPRVGDLEALGIRSIFQKIYSSQAFTLAFYKQDSERPKKEYKELREAQLAEVTKIIQDTKAAKKGVSSKAEELIAYIQDNPILPYKKGELRVLTGYKLQFESRDGGYDCKDLDFPDGPDNGKNNIRPVNIKTLVWLVYDGVKYTTE